MRPCSATAGTSNLLEAVRIKDADPIVVLAGSSEENNSVMSHLLMSLEEGGYPVSKIETL
ncbi:MAG: hypothetical protein LUO89_00300 [Methanothrix sp.]|nr:hypothetical protein [Methanothrix sp.]